MADLNDSLCEDEIKQELGKPFVLYNQVQDGRKNIHKAEDISDSLNEEDFNALSQLQSPSFLQQKVTTDCLNKIKRLNDSLDEGEVDHGHEVGKSLLFKSPHLELNKSKNNNIDVQFQAEEVLPCSTVASVIVQQSPKESAHSMVSTIPHILTPPTQNTTILNVPKVKPSFGKKIKKQSIPAGQEDSVKGATASAGIIKKQKSSIVKKSSKSKDLCKDMKKKQSNKIKSKLPKSNENAKKHKSSLLQEDKAPLGSMANQQKNERADLNEKTCKVNKSTLNIAISDQEDNPRTQTSSKEISKKPDFLVKGALSSVEEKASRSEELTSQRGIPKKPEFSGKKSFLSNANMKDQASDLGKNITKPPKKRKPAFLLKKTPSSTSTSNNPAFEMKETSSVSEMQKEKLEKEAGSLQPSKEKKQTSSTSEDIASSNVTSKESKPTRKVLTKEERAEMIKQRQLKKEGKEREKEQRIFERELKKKQKEEEKVRKKEKREALKAARIEAKAELENKNKFKAQQKTSESIPDKTLQNAKILIDESKLLTSSHKTSDIVSPENFGGQLEVQLDAFNSDISTTSSNRTSPFPRTSGLPSSSEAEVPIGTTNTSKRPLLKEAKAEETQAKRLRHDDSNTSRSDVTFGAEMASSEIESGIVMLDSPSSVSSKQSSPDGIPASQEKPRAKTRMKANMTGPVWVQCCNKRCQKWRQLQDHFDPLAVPAFWNCSDNTDKDHNHCSLPTEEWMEYENENIQFVESAYIPGSVVWAKMDSYPW